MKWFFAQTIGSPADLGIPTNEASASSLNSILNTVYFIAGAVAVLMLIIAGINYAVAAGDSNKLVKARNGILGAVIGVVIILAAFVLTNFITGRLR